MSKTKTLRSTAYALAFALVASLIVAPIAAQETVGSVAGTVRSEADGAALPGVTVTLTSDATGAAQIQVTGGSGDFRFVSLAVGSYTLQAQLEGFQTLTQEMVMVSVGRETRVDVRMPSGAVEDQITVTSEAPTIDVSSTVSGVTINTSQFTERVPVVREVTQIALVAPGTTGGDTAFNSSGSNYTPGQNLTSIGGASVAENTYLVNGLNITNFRNGVGGSNVPFEFVQEVQVKTGGYEAEFGRSTGGVLNMVTKSGSNRFSGGANIYFQPESLQEQAPDYYNGFNSEEEFESTEANAFLGGPIWKDKAFFFAFYQYNDVDGTAVGITRQTQRIRDDPYYGGKLDINFTPSQRLEGTYFTDEVTVQSSDTGIDTATRARTGNIGVGNYDAGGENIVAKYTGIFGSNFVASAQWGNNVFNRTAASTGDAFPYIIDSRDGDVALGNWVNWNRGLADDEREAFRVDFDYFRGNHSLRAGLDDELNTSNDVSEYSGGEYFRYFVNGSRFPEVPPETELTRYRIFRGGGTYDTQSNAYYLQDSWEVNDKLMVNLGLRNENFDNKNALGESFIKIDDQWAPRLGFTYDRNGDGKSKFWGSFGRYHLYIASNTNIRLAGAELFTEDWYVTPAGCDYANPTFASCTAQVLQMNVFGAGTVPDVRTTRSNTIDPMYQDEIALGYEWQQSDNWTFGVAVRQREFGEIIEDITIDAALVAAGLADPGEFEYRLVNPGGGFEGFYDSHGAIPIIPVSFTAAQLGYPAPVRDYVAGEFTFYRRLADKWTLQGSLVLSKSDGNYEGYVRSDNGQDDAGITTLYDFAGLLDGADGNLPNDRPYNAKVFGGYQFDNGVFVGAAASIRDGRPINAFGVHPTDPFAALYGAESFFNQGTLVPRGTVGRTEEIMNFDLTAKKDWDLGGSRLTLRADVFNIFDESGVTEVDESADEESGAPNAQYLEPVRFQTPRRVRLMLGISR